MERGASDMGNGLVLGNGTINEDSMQIVVDSRPISKKISYHDSNRRVSLNNHSETMPISYPLAPYLLLYSSNLLKFSSL